jgi:hypothetical protein
MTGSLGLGRLLPVAIVTLSACTAADSDGPDAGLPVLTASEPTLDIGVVEGDANYSFAAVAGALRLDDGSVVVADEGNTRISVFGSDGVFVRSWGSRGEGPGEFRTLSRVYRLAADSIMAADLATSRLTVFDLAGTRARELAGFDLSRDSTFQLDSWLYGRFWIDGGLDAAARDAIERALDRLPPPRDPPGYRMVRAARSGELWIEEPVAASDSTSTWMRTDATGQPAALVVLPARFTPLDIVGDDVLGVWLDENDVNFVHGYRLTNTGVTGQPPPWVVVVDSTSIATPAPTDEELRAVMRESIRGMAMAQEMNYARRYTYTTEIDSLDFERPADLGISFTHANTRGWAAVFTHPSIDRLCALAYGFGTPPGWAPGGISCGLASTPVPPL